jgi:predicted DNA-binding mobile mystery protein A
MYMSKHAPKNATNIARTRLDSRLSQLRSVRAQMAAPRGGWSKAIRTALGMTLEDLANRLGITRSVLLRLETSEQKETIQIDTLRRVADAMNCDLVYALIPRQPLQEMVDEQRAYAAKVLNVKTRTHMRLEGQDESDPSLADWRKEHSASLIGDRQLWKTRR